MKVETFVTMNYDEFDALAAKIGLNVEFIAIQEANNDTNYTFEVDDFSIKHFDATELQSKYVGAHAILTALVIKGLLPKAKYLVTVSW